MRTRSLTTLALGALLALALGCRGDDDGTEVDGGPDDGADGAASEVTVYDVQSDDMPVGTPVTLRGVVVTAVDTHGSRTGGVYVMEPDGGPFSGVFIYLNDTSAAGLTAGDLVDVEGGVKEEFALSDDTTGRTLTEISPPEGGSISITRVGDGTVPAPEVVNPWDLAADDAEAEKWEGVLVQFDDVSVITAPHNVSSSDSTLFEMEVTGPFPVQSALTELPDTITRGDCYASIVGIGDYFFDYKILPRSADDLTGGGSDCLPEEEGETACMDGDDNDYDGYADCADISCQDTVAACVEDTDVVSIQDGTISTGTAVNLTDVVVTGLSHSRKYLWVQDAGGAAENNGIYVYRGRSRDIQPVGEDIQIGAVVDIQGRVDEFETVTQVVDPTITFGSAGGTAEVLTGVDYVDLTDDTAAEPYEGVLVEVSNVEVQSIDAQNNTFMIGDAQNQVLVDDFIYRYTPTEGECYATLRGIVHRYEGSLQLLPRSADDLETGGTCN